VSHSAEFQRLRAADRRLHILQFLAEEPDYTLNSSLLQSALATMGHSVSRDLIHADGAWLVEMGLITLEELGYMRLFTLTARGEDVALGRAAAPGVRRPVPKV